MSPPPCSDSPSARSSTSFDGDAGALQRLGDRVLGEVEGAHVERACPCGRSRWRAGRGDDDCVRHWCSLDVRWCSDFGSREYLTPVSACPSRERLARHVGLRPLLGFGRRVHLDVEVPPPMKMPSSEKSDVIAQRHGHPVADDLDVDRVERPRCADPRRATRARWHRARAGSSRSVPARSASTSTPFAAAVAAASAIDDSSRRSATARQRSRPKPAEEHQRDARARAPTA